MKWSEGLAKGCFKELFLKSIDTDTDGLSTRKLILVLDGGLRGHTLQRGHTA